MLDQSSDDGREQFPAAIGRHLEHHGLVEMVWIDQLALEKPVLNRGQRDLLSGSPLMFVLIVLSAQAGAACQLCDRWVIKNLLGSDSQAGAIGFGCDLKAQD